MYFGRISLGNPIYIVRISFKMTIFFLNSKTCWNALCFQKKEIYFNNLLKKSQFWIFLIRWWILSKCSWIGFFGFRTGSGGMRVGHRIQRHHFRVSFLQISQSFRQQSLFQGSPHSFVFGIFDAQNGKDNITFTDKDQEDIEALKHVQNVCKVPSGFMHMFVK